MPRLFLAQAAPGGDGGEVFFGVGAAQVERVHGRAVVGGGEGRVQQRVPIIPNKYEPSFQSFTGEDELALRRLLMQERDGLKAPDRYLMDKFQLMTLALGIVRINQTVFPSHINSRGEFDDDLFWQKFTKILKLPFHMLASMGVHYYWFDVRVRKLFVAERLKNG